jgi:hypothetical protein
MTKENSNCKVELPFTCIQVKLLVIFMYWCPFVILTLLGGDASIFPFSDAIETIKNDEIETKTTVERDVGPSPSKKMKLEHDMNIEHSGRRNPILQTTGAHPVDSMEVFDDRVRNSRFKVI